MKLIIDCERDSNGFPIAYHFIDTDTPEGKKVIEDMNGDPSLHEAAGYATETKLPGVPDGTTRWDVVVTECNRQTAPAELKAFKAVSVDKQVQPKPVDIAIPNP